jgi:hypothetical protein
MTVSFLDSLLMFLCFHDNHAFDTYRGEPDKGLLNSLVRLPHMDTCDVVPSLLALHDRAEVVARATVSAPDLSWSHGARKNNPQSP